MAAQTGPWLTCALTQLGFVRLLANSAVVNQVVSPVRAAELLTAMTADPMHIYLSGSPALDGQMFQRAMGHDQVTDVYLLHLAAGNQARFLTLDRRLDKLAAGICGLEVLQ
jgi:predicted nucleic acid-binding protein